MPNNFENHDHFYYEFVSSLASIWIQSHIKSTLQIWKEFSEEEERS